MGLCISMSPVAEMVAVATTCSGSGMVVSVGGCVAWVVGVVSWVERVLLSVWTGSDSLSSRLPRSFQAAKPTPASSRRMRRIRRMGSRGLDFRRWA